MHSKDAYNDKHDILHGYRKGLPRPGKSFSRKIVLKEIGSKWTKVSFLLKNVTTTSSPRSHPSMASRRPTARRGCVAEGPS
jgi:hypothetical protein